MTVHRSSTGRVLHFIRLELAPFPGRLSGSLRDVLGIVIAVTIVMTLHVPGIALALALVFLLQRERPALTLRSGLQILGGCAFACAATLLWVQLTDGTEVARFLGMILGIFMAGFCMEATRYPLFFTLFGFYGFVDLSLWDAHQSVHWIVAAILNSLASLCIVIGVTIAVEQIFRSRHPKTELRQEMDRRLRLVADFFHELAKRQSSQRAERMTVLHHRQVQYAHAGDLRMNELYKELSDDIDTVSVR